MFILVLRGLSKAHYGLLATPRNTEYEQAGTETFMDMPYFGGTTTFSSKLDSF
jgi:hypothetical protein